MGAADLVNRVAELERRLELLLTRVREKEAEIRRLRQQVDQLGRS